MALSHRCSFFSGINAASHVSQDDPFIVSRTDSYIGVLIDDLTSLGTDEPYRMFTSRVEFRLTLRPDNADVRLTKRGFEHGVVDERRYQRFCKTQERIEEAIKIAKGINHSRQQWSEMLPADVKISLTHTSRRTAYDILSIENMTFRRLAEIFPEQLASYVDIGDTRVVPISVYSYMAKNQAKRMEEIKKEGDMKLPDNVDYGQGKLTDWLSLECREKLNFYQPQTVAAASRIPGMTPDALLFLMRFAKEHAAAAEVQKRADVG